jgi:ribosomal protein S6
MERFFRINDKVLKFMTVLLDEAADLTPSKLSWRKKKQQKRSRRLRQSRRNR